MLSKLHAHTRDQYVKFYEVGHKYEVKGETNYTSVTTVVHHMFPEFDSIGIARKMVDNPNFPGAYRYKKYRKLVAGLGRDDTITALLNEWTRNCNEAATLGTRMHKDIEDVYNGISVENKSKEFTYFSKYFEYRQRNDFIPYRTEWCLYDTDSRIVGTIDMLYTQNKQQDGKEILTMVDWKRSKKIKKRNFFSSGLGCMSHEDDCNFIHYSIQLNLYKYILEKNYNVIIQSMYILICHPDNKTYLEFEIPNRQDDILNIVWDHVRDNTRD